MNDQERDAEASAKSLAWVAKHYVLTGARGCPLCHSTDLTGDRFEANSDEVWQHVECNKCGATWDEVYKLTSIDNLQRGKEGRV